MFMKNKNLFRKNLVARRKALGLTQEQLAVRMNVSRSQSKNGKTQAIPTRSFSHSLPER